MHEAGSGHLFHAFEPEHHEADESLEVDQTGVGNRRVGEVEPAKLGKAGNVSQTAIREGRIFELEKLQLLQRFEVNERGLGDWRVFEVKPTEALDVTQKAKTLVAALPLAADTHLEQGLIKVPLPPVVSTRSSAASGIPSSFRSPAVGSPKISMTVFEAAPGISLMTALPFARVTVRPSIW